jgi:hypothetical protein
MGRESLQQPGPGGVSESFQQRLTTVGEEVIHDHVGGVGCGIADGDL